MIKRLFCALFAIAMIGFVAAADRYQIHNDEIWFLDNTNLAINGFDIETGQSLGSLKLTVDLVDFEIDANYWYLLSDRNLSKVSRTDKNKTHIRNFPSSTVDAELNQDDIFIYADAIYWVSLVDNSLVDTYGSGYNYNRWGSALSFSPEAKALFSLNSATNADQVFAINVEETGFAELSYTSSYSYNVNLGETLYLSSNGQQVIAANGLVYAANDLSWQASLAGNVEAIADYQGNRIILRKNEIIAFDDNFYEIGRASVAANVDALHVIGDKVYLFDASSGELTGAVALSDLNAPNSIPQLDISGKIIEPKAVKYDGGDSFWFYDEALSSIVEWSISKQSIQRSITLPDSATSWTVNAEGDRIYIGQKSGQIFQVDTSQDPLSLSPFTTLVGEVRHLQMVDQLIFATDPSTSWGNNYLFDADAQLKDTDTNFGLSHSYAWSNKTSRLYTMDYHALEYLEIDSVSETFGVTGYIGGLDYSGNMLDITFDPAESTLLLSNGVFVDPATAEYEDSLTEAIKDVVWLDDKLYTLNQDDNYSFVQWDATSYEKLATFSFAQKIYAIKGDDTHLHLIVAGNSNVDVISIDFENLPDSDNDEIHDYIDNCPNISNAEQANFDGDLYGDACDADKDNDGILNDDEVSFGLNPLDASDALADLDADGYSNIDEYKFGGDLQSAFKGPDIIQSFSYEFTEGEAYPLLQITNADTIASGLIGNFDPSDNYYKDLTALKLTQENYAQTPITITLEGYFPEGELNYDVVSLYGPSFVGFTSEIDGEFLYYYGHSITAGHHKIEFKTQPTNYPIDEARIALDYIRFTDYDEDRDGIRVHDDNCPKISNPSQLDLDKDGLGDSCDSDMDNDGIPNSLETDLGLNPKDAADALTDLDNDGYSNIEELKLGTEINNPESYPELVPYFEYSFENADYPLLKFENSIAARTIGLNEYLNESDREGKGLLVTGDANDDQNLQIILEGYFPAGKLVLGGVWPSPNGYYNIRLDESDFYYGEVTLNRGYHRLLISSSSYGRIENEILLLESIAFIDIDADKDGVLNEYDNCPKVANAEQLDSDADSLGDACDNDIDGDGLSNEVEITHGLNPLDAADSKADLDSDGFSNLHELKFGGDLNNADVGPVNLPYFDYNFADGKFHLLSFENVEAMSVVDLGVDAENPEQNNFALSISSELDAYEYMSILLEGYFPAGRIGYSRLYLPENVLAKLMVDGKAKAGSTYLEAGYHRVELRFTNEGDYRMFTAAVGRLYLTDTDQDKDGIEDEFDSCPAVANPSQEDENLNGIGDACEPLLVDQDQDGIEDDLDNCPAVANPGQEDADSNGVGDACEITASKPEESAKGSSSKGGAINLWLLALLLPLATLRRRS